MGNIDLAFFYTNRINTCFFELREVDMGAPLQDIRTKRLMGTIFRRKELGEASKPAASSVGYVEETPGHRSTMRFLYPR